MGPIQSQEEHPNSATESACNLCKRGAVSEELYALARGPDKQVLTHHGWCINGFLFHTIQAERHFKTQNSRVVVQGDEETSNITYHGQLTDIIVLQYIGRRHVTLFKCAWFEVSSQARGYREDRYGFISLNFSRHLKTNEPYILACQAAQATSERNKVNRSKQEPVKDKLEELASQSCHSPIASTIEEM
ncbi:hypothetical protein Taro_025403 [Colocasia esculenta]|uniref:DUF4216 domain-containing protein n=1 Tax=Colocasia esculenta TaxID=4460 RepID=A0A843V8S9_COLES|nr:hypothetical protein [Colocasia esculenta]